jgi:hypothetical protein
MIFKPSSFSSSNSASPYAYVQSPTGEKVGVVGENEFRIKNVTAGSEQQRENERWYWRTKQKKMMRAEVADAFKIRKWVVAFLACSGVGALLLSWAFLGWAAGVMSGLFLGGGRENKMGKDW